MILNTLYNWVEVKNDKDIDLGIRWFITWFICLIATMFIGLIATMFIGLIATTFDSKIYGIAISITVIYFIIHLFAFIITKENSDIKYDNKKIAIFFSVLYLITIGIVATITLSKYISNIGHYIIGVFLFAEILHFADKNDNPKWHKKLFWHTAEQKILKIFESAFLIFALNGLFIGTWRFYLISKQYWDAILKGIFVVLEVLTGIAILLAILWIYIKLNELKYKFRKKKK